MASTRLIETIRRPGGFTGLRFCVINHGCKVNKVEADTISAQLAGQGAVSAPEEEADLVIVNTCTVTGEADKKARKAVRHALKIAPAARVVVTGCGAAIDPSGFESIDERVSVVDRFDLLARTKPAQATGLRMGEGFRTRVNIKIQDGCDHACTYCIVHVARGPAKSMPFEEVVSEARSYLRGGAKELVLAGIDLASYRDGGRTLADVARALVAEADAASGEADLPARLRVSSLEPMTIDDDFIDLLASSEGRICRHLHIPVQSGSSKVLREMARPYTSDDYRKLTEKIREAVPEISLTTDIIVGFPGETDDDFNRTMELARECGFSKIHVFPYSKRAGTPAAKRIDQVPAPITQERASILRSLSSELRKEDLARRVGRTELALVETRFALTESYHEIPLPPDSVEGKLVAVTL